MEIFRVTSPAFQDGERIPLEYTGYGADRSPELLLSGLRGDAVSIAVVMNDMGHPIPAFNYWLIWNIPPLTVIPGDSPSGAQVEALNGAVQGVGYGRNRYRGPKPPFWSSHVYHFNVYVLDSMLDLPSSARKKALLTAMQGHILQQAALTGHYR